MSHRRWTWTGWLLAGVVTLGFGVFVVVLKQRSGLLDTADKVASVVGAVIAVIGLPLTVYGIVLARRSLAGSNEMPADPGGSVRQDVHAGRDAYISGRDQYFGRRPEDQ